MNQRTGSTESVAIIGLGYVGLPLLLDFAKSGARVIGFDTDVAKVEQLNAGRSYIAHLRDEVAAASKTTGGFEATADFSRISEVEAIIICVPTPLNQQHEPDLSHVRQTLDSIQPYLQKGQIISLESTTYPGTTEEEILPRVAAAGLTVGEDIHVVYSPERLDPGPESISSRHIPKVVSGVTSSCLQKGTTLYAVVFDGVVPVSSPKVAEFSKLLENIYRAVNIGLINEMKMVAQVMNIDIWESIEAASTKPFGFTPFTPGPGLGGHCVPIDPFYLTWKAKEYGYHSHFIELAGRINRSMPKFVVERVKEALASREKILQESRVLVIGVSYKSNIGDTRESPAFALMDLLSSHGAAVDYYDPHVLEIGETRDFPQWKGKQSIEWSQGLVQDYDCLLISTMHDLIDREQLEQWAQLIVDTRNTVNSNQDHVFSA